MEKLNVNSPMCQSNASNVGGAAKFNNQHEKASQYDDAKSNSFSCHKIDQRSLLWHGNEFDFSIVTVHVSVCSSGGKVLGDGCER